VSGSEGKASAGGAETGEDSEDPRLAGAGANGGCGHLFKGRARSGGGGYC
jgi:hypothetical protein